MTPILQSAARGLIVIFSISVFGVYVFSVAPAKKASPTDANSAALAELFGPTSDVSKTDSRFKVCDVQIPKVKASMDSLRIHPSDWPPIQYAPAPPTVMSSSKSAPVSARVISRIVRAPSLAFFSEESLKLSPTPTSKGQATPIIPYETGEPGKAPSDGQTERFSIESLNDHINRSHGRLPSFEQHEAETALTWQSRSEKPPPFWMPEFAKQTSPTATIDILSIDWDKLEGMLAFPWETAEPWNDHYELSRILSRNHTPAIQPTKSE